MLAGLIIAVGIAAVLGYLNFVHLFSLDVSQRLVTNAFIIEEPVKQEEVPPPTATSTARRSNTACASFEIPTGATIESPTVGYHRIQNYVAHDGPQPYPAGAFFIEVMRFNPEYGTPDEQEAALRDGYDSVREVTLAGKRVLYATGRHPGGDSWPGTSYFVKGVCTINLSAEGDAGIQNAEAVVKTAQWR